MKTKVMLLILSGFILFRGNVAQTATFVVNTTDDTVDANPGDGVAADARGYCSLRAAIMEANALAGRDTIVLPEGIFTLTIEGTDEEECLSGDLNIKSGLVIQGAGRDLTFIDGNQIDRVFYIKGNINVSILDLTIQNGKTRDGGSPPSITEGGCGGGILNRFATLNIENCDIINNLTGKGGSNDLGYFTGPSGGFGGGIYNKQGTTSIKNSRISNNRTGRGGDAIYGGGGGDGGGIFNCNDSTMTLDNCTINENTTGNFGRGWEDGNGGNGGGVCNAGRLAMIDCTVKDNICGDGGFEGGGGDGGGIRNSRSGSAEISNSLIAGNTTGDSLQDYTGGCGGGISNSGDLLIKNCTLSGNRTKPGAYLGAGGGISNLGDATIMNCTICQNVDYWYGGGICNAPWVYSSVVSIKNTIIANNSTAFPWDPQVTYSDDSNGIITSLGYNLIRAIAGGTIVGDETGNIYGSNPLLEALADNGGPTMTHKLLPASPAIDAGHPSDFENTDQRGVTRPKDGDGVGGARSDIGAFERFSPSVTITSPEAGESVCGAISIEATANTEHVDFYIDDMLMCKSVTSPFICSWDTILYANGSHQIKAVAYDAEYAWLAAQDLVHVIVDNTVLNLNVSRIKDRAWIISREYGTVTFNITHAGWVAVSKYIIERKEEGGTYSIIAEISESELASGSYTYNDLLPNKNVSYAYRVRAVDSTNMTVGMSEEVTI